MTLAFSLPRWFIILISLGVIVVGAMLLFHRSCSKAPLSYQPITSSEHQAAFQDAQRRIESSTYLTFPEWYLVFNPQELGRFLQQAFPSQFGYWRSISQFWGGYCQVYGIANEVYDANPGDQFMILVIGSSFSVEYAVKGVYASTIGWLFEKTARELTDEDRYAAYLQTDYGQFVETRPFYEYPFGKAFVGIWKQPWFGKGIARKWERKLALSFEYGIKTIYSKIIWAGTRLLYGAPDDIVYVLVSEKGATSTSMRTLPHYKEFTRGLPQLAASGTRILSVAGNDEILASVIASTTTTMDLAPAQLLFVQPFIEEQKQRYVYQVPTDHLIEFVQSAQKQGLELEHVFDY